MTNINRFINKKILVFIAAAVCSTEILFANNTSVTINQVSSAITLSGDEDLHITNTTPFTSSGSIDVTNTEYAVIILDNVKPSVAVKQLQYITINGLKAVNNSTCQVKIYNQGSIIMPYSNSIKPLTVYSEKKFGGTSVNDFGTESSGGFMNTLTDAKLNNKIRSFKLKRGYMVTFSTRSGGYGYSRCFVADNSDLEISELPTILDKRISSYRIFKWNDASKKGLANNTGSEANEALNTSWCYSFGLGEDAGINRECVPHHIYEGWPAISDCGNCNYTTSTPTMKTNNEPGNTSDDHPQTVDEVLANWQQLMATGLRLCSPSSHDGSLTWMKNFMDSIDARGWRCDVVDIHSYWTTNQFYNLSSWYSQYQRPLWISEWCWGASWNKNGAFSSSLTDDQAKTQNASNVQTICEVMNGYEYVERYAYWNSEADRSKLYLNGTLTAAGNYYANENSGIGYNKKYEYIPTEPKYYSPSGLTATFKPNVGICTLSWNNNNADLCDSIIVERKVGINGTFTSLGSIAISETSTTFSFVDSVSSAGNYTYRIHEIGYDRKNYYSNEAYNIISGAEGNGDFQYGTITATSTADSYNYFSEPFDVMPVIVFGGTTNTSANLAPVEHVYTSYKSGGKYAYFKFNFFPWTLSYFQTLYGGAETTHYIATKPGNGTIGSLNYEAGYIHSESNLDSTITVGKDTVYCPFKVPFAEGTKPVVFVTPRYTSMTYPYMWRVWDITNKGFKVILQRQEGISLAGFLKQYVAYFAIDRGKTKYGEGKLMRVDTTSIRFKNKAISYQLNYNDKLVNPIYLSQLQSFNRKFAAILRTRKNGSDSLYTTIRIQPDSTATNATLSVTNYDEENIGWIAISTDTTWTNTNINGIQDDVRGTVTVYPAVAQNNILIKDDKATMAYIFNMNGMIMMKTKLIEGRATLDITKLPANMYLIRTNASNTTKFVKQ
jgi:hypothetical protein